MAGYMAGAAALPGWFWPTVAGLTGAAVASFLAVVAERVPAGMSIGGRSRCACGRQLDWWQNVPVVGWLAARGVASCCGAKIPLSYLAAELIGAGGAAAAVAVLDGVARWAALAAVAVAVLAVSRESTGRS